MVAPRHFGHSVKALFVRKQPFASRTGIASRREKVTSLVHFPIEGLNMKPFVSGPCEESEAIYDLYAVSNHMGEWVAAITQRMHSILIMASGMNLMIPAHKKLALKMLSLQKHTCSFTADGGLWSNKGKLGKKGLPRLKMMAISEESSLW